MPRQDLNVEIRIDRIPLSGGIGAALASVVPIGALLLELPGLRRPTFAGVAGGLMLGAGFIVWRRWRRH
jgi:LPXTG-motif cell wall-anchored protein